MSDPYSDPLESCDDKFMLRIEIRDNFLVIGFLENDSAGLNLHHEAKISKSALKTWLDLPTVFTTQRIK